MTTGALIAGLVISGQSGRHTPPAAIGAAHPSLSIAKTSASPASQSPVTSAAVVYRLKQLLPPGTTSDYGRAGNGTVFGQIALDRGHGPNMLRLHVGTTPSGPYHCGDYTDPTLSIQCATLPDGARFALIRFADDCNQSLVVDLFRSNGVNVLLNVMTCQTTNGHANPPALSQAEAVRIADDPGWGLTMDSTLVAAAQREFPDLPKTFNN
jgi:hypothetical protein